MSYGRRYEGDPRWITARFGHCAQCKTPLAGKRTAYFPNGKVCFCEKCGEAEMNAFECSAADEDMLTMYAANY